MPSGGSADAGSSRKRYLLIDGNSLTYRAFFALPTDLAEGEHAVEVRAFDRWQGERSARTSYRLQVAEP